MQRRHTDKTLSETFQAMKRKRPSHAAIIDTFSELYLAQAALARDFAAHDFGLPAHDPERCRQGVSLLVDALADSSTDAPAFRCAGPIEASRRAILPVLQRSFPFTDQLRVLEERTGSGTLDLHQLALAYLRGEAAELQQASDRTGVTLPVLTFVVRCVLGPVLAGLAQGMADALATLPWGHGHCPVCGSAPNIASLSRFDNTGNEGLVGGGGKKRLACSLCSHEWAFRRDACPGCGNTDHNQREVLWDLDNRHERIEACKKCGSYLLCIDLREVEGDVSMEAAPLGLLHLDIIAQQRNYSPLAAMPWNLDE